MAADETKLCLSYPLILFPCNGIALAVLLDIRTYSNCLVCYLRASCRWVLPFIGHMGICTSAGVIRDFAGSYFVSVSTAFASSLSHHRIETDVKVLDLLNGSLKDRFALPVGSNLNMVLVLDQYYCVINCVQI